MTLQYPTLEDRSHTPPCGIMDAIGFHDSHTEYAVRTFLPSTIPPRVYVSTILSSVHTCSFAFVDLCDAISPSSSSVHLRCAHHLRGSQPIPSSGVFSPEGGEVQSSWFDSSLGLSGQVVGVVAGRERRETQGGSRPIHSRRDGPMSSSHHAENLAFTTGDSRLENRNHTMPVEGRPGC